MKYQYRVFTHNLSKITASITLGKWSKNNPGVAHIEVRYFVPDAENILKSAARGACDRLNEEASK